MNIESMWIKSCRSLHVDETTPVEALDRLQSSRAGRRLSRRSRAMAVRY